MTAEARTLDPARAPERIPSLGQGRRPASGSPIAPHVGRTSRKANTAPHDPRRRGCPDRPQPWGLPSRSRTPARPRPCMTGHGHFSVSLPVRDEQFFDGHIEQTSKLEGRREAWIVPAVFNRIDRLSRYLQLPGQFRLGPVFGRPPFTQNVLHWKRRFDRRNPTNTSRTINKSVP